MLKFSTINDDNNNKIDRNLMWSHVTGLTTAWNIAGILKVVPSLYLTQPSRPSDGPSIATLLSSPSDTCAFQVDSMGPTPDTPKLVSIRAY